MLKSHLFVQFYQFTLRQFVCRRVNKYKSFVFKFTSAYETTQWLQFGWKPKTYHEILVYRQWQSLNVTVDVKREPLINGIASFLTNN